MGPNVATSVASESPRIHHEVASRRARSGLVNVMRRLHDSCTAHGAICQVCAPIGPTRGDQFGPGKSNSRMLLERVRPSQASPLVAKVVPVRVGAPRAESPIENTSTRVHACLQSCASRKRFKVQERSYVAERRDRRNCRLTAPFSSQSALLGKFEQVSSLPCDLNLVLFFSGDFFRADRTRCE